MRLSTSVASFMAFASAFAAFAPAKQHLSLSEHSLSTYGGPTSLSAKSTIDSTWHIENCDNNWQLIVKDAHTTAEVMMEFVVEKHNENASKPGSTARKIFELYFGQDPAEEAVVFVGDKLERVLHAMKHTTYVCRKSQSDCISFAAAMVVGGGKPEYHAVDGGKNVRVDICPAYFNRPEQLVAKMPRATAFQIQVLVHEATHTLPVPEAPGGINDLEFIDPGSSGLTYGEQKAQQLAAYSSEAALVSAENYKLYVAALLRTYETGRMPKYESINHGPAPEWTSLWQNDLRTTTTMISMQKTLPTPPSSTPTNLLLERDSSTSLTLESQSLSIPTSISSSTATIDSTLTSTLSGMLIAARGEDDPPSSPAAPTGQTNTVDDSLVESVARLEDRLKQAMGLEAARYDWVKLSAVSAAPVYVFEWWAPYTLAAVAGFMICL